MARESATMKEDLKEIREHILDLYLDVKVRSNEEVCKPQ